MAFDIQIELKTATGGKKYHFNIPDWPTHCDAMAAFSNVLTEFAKWARSNPPAPGEKTQKVGLRAVITEGTLPGGFFQCPGEWGGLPDRAVAQLTAFLDAAEKPFAKYKVP